MFISDLQRSILTVLRDGPLDHHQVAADLVKPPWLIRETLRALRREQLVDDELRPRAIVWRLTAKGQSVVWAGEQLALTEAAS